VRPEGYYWVRHFATICVAEWSDGAWWFTGIGGPVEPPSRIEVLSERLEPPRVELSPREVLAVKQSGSITDALPLCIRLEKPEGKQS
jgi:hypothetical protein